MGANEKRDATYHGGEYTPSTENVRSGYIEGMEGFAGVTQFEYRSEFDRWLEAVRTQSKAEAWEECARSIVYEDGTPVEIASITNPYK